jgi:hypothetical protein
MKEMTTQVYSGPKWVISNVHLFGTKIPGPDPAPLPLSSLMSGSELRVGTCMCLDSCLYCNLHYKYSTDFYSFQAITP